MRELVLRKEEILTRLTQLREEKLALDKKYYDTYLELLKIFIIHEPEMVKNNFSDLAVIYEQREEAQDILNEKINDIKKSLIKKEKLISECDLNIKAMEMAKEAELNTPYYVNLLNNVTKKEEQLKLQYEQWKELDDEIAFKLKAYKKNKYYQYLKKRNFNKICYNGKCIARVFDRWLAGKVRFYQNSQNECILNELKAKNDSNLHKHKHELENEKALYDKAITDMELSVSIKEQKNRLSNLHNRLKIKMEEKDRLENNVNLILNNMDNYFNQIRKKIEKTISSLSHSSLKKLVESTDNKEDDVVFEKLVHIYKHLQLLDEEIKHNQKLLKSIDKKIEIEKKSDSFVDDSLGVFSCGTPSSSSPGSSAPENSDSRVSKDYEYREKD